MYNYIYIFFVLDDKNNDLSLNVYTSFDLPNTDGEAHMSLSIAWSLPDEDGSQSIAFSDSRGYVTLVNLNDRLVRSFKAHNFESWTVAFNYGDPNILYTGHQMFQILIKYSIFYNISCS